MNTSTGLFWSLTHAHPHLLLFVAHPIRCATAAGARSCGAKLGSVVSDAVPERAPNTGTSRANRFKRAANRHVRKQMKNVKGLQLTKVTMETTGSTLHWLPRLSPEIQTVGLRANQVKDKRSRVNLFIVGPLHNIHRPMLAEASLALDSRLLCSGGLKDRVRRSGGAGC